MDPDLHLSTRSRIQITDTTFKKPGSRSDKNLDPPGSCSAGKHGSKRMRIRNTAKHALRIYARATLPDSHHCPLPDHRQPGRCPWQPERLDRQPGHLAREPAGCLPQQPGRHAREPEGRLPQQPGRHLPQQPGRLAQQPDRRLPQQPGRHLPQQPGRRLPQQPGRLDRQAGRTRSLKGRINFNLNNYFCRQFFGILVLLVRIRIIHFFLGPDPDPLKKRHETLTTSTKNVFYAKNTIYRIVMDVK